MEQGHRPTLSIVTVLFNMQREAPRTLLSLSAAYQHGVSASDYEVLVVDSGSDKPLPATEIERFGPNFHALYSKPRLPTPLEAIATGVKRARGKYLAIAIDGARIVSPGWIRNCLVATATIPEAFVYTAGMHLGPQPQQVSMLQGYNQAVEDQLLNQTGWQQDGYRLFGTSVLAGSSDRGILAPLSESNLFMLSRENWDRLGGYADEFRTLGGGYANLDIFKRAVESPHMRPVALLGETTFHQFHGGASANAPAGNNLSAAYKAEYEQIRGEPFRRPTRSPVYFGKLAPQLLPRAAAKPATRT